MSRTIVLDLLWDSSTAESDENGTLCLGPFGLERSPVKGLCIC